MRLRAALLLTLVPLAGLAAGTADYARLPGGAFKSVLKYEDAPGRQQIAPFALMKPPATNGEFLAFVKANPQWRRDKVARVFADDRCSMVRAINVVARWQLSCPNEAARGLAPETRAVMAYRCCPAHRR